MGINQLRMASLGASSRCNTSQVRQAVAGGDYLVPPILECPLQLATGDQVVLGDEDPHNSLSFLSRCMTGATRINRANVCDRDLPGMGGRAFCRACTLRLGRSLALPKLAQSMIATWQTDNSAESSQQAFDFAHEYSVIFLGLDQVSASGGGFQTLGGRNRGAGHKVTRRPPEVVCQSLHLGKRLRGQGRLHGPQSRRPIVHEQLRHFAEELPVAVHAGQCRRVVEHRVAGNRPWAWMRVWGRGIV